MPPIPPVALTNEPFSDRMLRAITLMEAEVPGLVTLAEQFAERVVATGRLFASGAPNVVHEWCGRSGGLMLVKPLRDTLTPEDALLHADAAGYALPEPGSEVSCLKASVGASPGNGMPHLPSRAHEAGLSETVAAALAGMTFTAEFVAACTRLGRMPVMFESIGMYNGSARIHAFRRGEQPFHGEDDRFPASVAPQRAETLARVWLHALRAAVERLERQMRPRLTAAAAWGIEARARGQRVAMMTMGAHLFPREVTESEMGVLFEGWNWPTGFSGRKMPELDFGPGDVVYHIGYQHPPTRILCHARDNGYKVVYSAVLEDRDFRDAADVIWIDPMFRWEDAVVPLEGYPVPILAPSGMLNAVLTWELYRLVRRDSAA
jgi:hypothetical protein